MPGTYWEEMALGWASLSFLIFFFKLSTNMPCDLTQACVFRSGSEQKVLPPACKQHMDV